MEKRHRMTLQRRVILEELEKTAGHPSASELYERVRKRLPHISLGTVYRNLDILCAQGTILRLELGSGQRRFDARTQEHYHIRCIVCERVDDVPQSGHGDIGTILADAARSTGYEVRGVSVDLYGICPECRRRYADGHSGDG